MDIVNDQRNKDVNKLVNLLVTIFSTEEYIYLNKKDYTISSNDVGNSACIKLRPIFRAANNIVDIIYTNSKNIVRMSIDENKIIINTSTVEKL